MILENERVKKLLNTMEGVFGICVTDAEGTIQFINNHFCNIVHSETSQLIDNSFNMLNIYLDKQKTPFFDVIQNEEVWKGEVFFKAFNEEEKWLDLIVMPIFDSENNVGNYAILANDITEIREIQQLASETTDSLKNITKALDEASIVAITDENGVIQHVNDKFCEISKFKRRQLVGKTHRIINSRHHPKSFFKEMWETIVKGDVWKGEVKNRAKDGTYYWVHTTIVPFLDKTGKPKQFIAIRTDITQRIEAETELARVMEDDFRKVVKNLQNWIFKIEKKDGSFKVLLSEGMLAEKYQFTTEKIRGKTVYDIFDYRNARKIEEQFIKAYLGNKVHSELEIKNLYIDLVLTPVIENKLVTEVVGSVTDITARKKAEEMIIHMANYDPLTKLVNRNHFSDLLNIELNKASEKKQNVAVLFLDLDRFKNINDSLGHHTGDRILIKVAKLVETTVRKIDIVSRLGGDEFAIFLPNVGRKEAGIIAERIIKRMSNPVALETLELYVTPSIGISLYPNDGKTVEDLLKNADAAMYLAKKQGKNNYQFYTQELRDTLLNKLELEIDLRKALEGNELELFYQTKMDIENDKIIGAEALIRWNHPIHGLVSPDNFIPIAEETGLIIKIGEWVLEEACRQAKQWHDDGHDGLTIAVNISMRQFLQNNLHIVIEDILKKTELDPQYLELEITESMTLDAEYTIQMLNKIKSLGVIVSIDDFGTGYSSLSYLSRFPVDKLKIDQSFVRELSDTNKSIIKAIINVADSLNIDVIAEGVEEEEHVEFLMTQNCKEAQGYYFSKPVPKAKVNKILEKTLKVSL